MSPHGQLDLFDEPNAEPTPSQRDTSNSEPPTLADALAALRAAGINFRIIQTSWSSGE